MNDNKEQNGTTTMEPESILETYIISYNGNKEERIIATPVTLTKVEPVATTTEIEDVLLSCKDASRVMDCTYGTVYRLCEGGVLKAKHVQSGGKKAFAIRKGDLERWLQKPGQRMKYKQLYWERVSGMVK